MPLYYFAIEPQSKQFPSRGDIVTFNVNVVGVNGMVVEVNDLVSFVYDGQICNALITQVNTQSQSVEVRIISPKAMNKQVQVPVRQLRFYAKGFSPIMNTMRGVASNQMQRNVGLCNQPQLTSSLSMSSQGSASGSMQMTSNTHAIEVVVIDAPCVVKVVPYDDVMYVENHDEKQDIPSILPLVRMKCGTMLVVRAPATDATQ
ncbi:hypothetical protein AV274_0993 [Blastocystis sp. ATCC 50177/Nand II]|uniref:Uncharacterized protein n=1 Tax=Blastocystis sp. subtype 1 (strain ATCC 50177 / NandII) TaxID=478820 RepID=A0A196SM41_BLAHN|nr:hypothetical protein AV274_0993 [Blastocystis sp. ATCC 50177/Nand II]